jgi:hypothetical protein
MGEEQQAQETRKIIETVLSAARKHALAFPEQQWVIYREEGLWRACPFATICLYNVNGKGEQALGLVRVHLAQKDRVFNLRVIAGLVDLLNDDELSVEKLARHLEDSQELQFTMLKATTCNAACLYDFRKGKMATGVFLEKVNGKPNGLPEVEKVPSSRSIDFADWLLATLSRLGNAAAWVDHSPDREGMPFPPALQAFSGLILGAPAALAGGNPEGETGTLIYLYRTIVRPLEDYQRLRGLEYDDF